MRKYASSAVIVLLVIGLGVTVFFLAESSRQAANLDARIAAVEKERADLQARLRPFEMKQRAVIRIDNELLVPAKSVQNYRFSPAVVPGTLSGSWRSSGRGWGGVDDTITAIRLSDPKDVLLYSSPRGSSGSFVVKLTAPGPYTFFVDNAGLFRNTPRRVFLEGEFRPD